MEAIRTFVKATIVGGLMFLVPIVLIGIVLKRALEIAMNVARPVAAALPPSVTAGFATVTLVAVLTLVLLAFLAGLIARTAVGRKVTGWFEESLLGGMPQYHMVKSMAEGLAQLESGKDFKPVLVRGDEGWQVAYLIEDLSNGWLAVFLPQAPTPLAGNVLYVEAARVRALNIPMTEVTRLVKRIGLGSAAALRGVDLGPGTA